MKIGDFKGQTCAKKKFVQPILYTRFLRIRVTNRDSESMQIKLCIFTKPMRWLIAHLRSSLYEEHILLMHILCLQSLQIDH